jgi:hypothetical protein
MILIPKRTTQQTNKQTHTHSMNKHNFVLAIILLVIFVITASAKVTFRSMGSVRDFKVGLDGNLYYAGIFTTSGNVGGVAISVSGTMDNSFVAKVSSTGSVIWVKSFAATGNFQVAAVHADTAGHVYVSGSFSGTFHTEKPASADYAATSETDLDVFIMKLDVTGESLWFQKHGVVGYDSASNLRVSPSGDVYISGILSGAYTFPGGIEAQTNNGGVDVFILKMDKDGNPLWVRSFGSAGNEWTYSLAVGQDNSVAISGYYNSDITIGSTTLVRDGGVFNGYVACYAADGTFKFAKSFVKTTTNGVSVAFGPIVDSVLPLYVAGLTADGTVAIGPQAGGLSTSAFGGNNVFVAKFDAITGNNMWIKVIGGENHGLAVGGDGSVYVGISFLGSVILNSITYTTSGGRDAMVAKLGSDGSVLWAVKAGGADNEYGGRIAVLGTQIFMSGTFSNTFSFAESTINHEGPANIENSFFVDFSPYIDWPVADYGAPKVQVAATYNSGTDSIRVTVDFPKHASLNVYNRIATTDSLSTTCILSGGVDDLTTGAGASWNLSPNPTYQSYVLQQSINSINAGGNQWVKTIDTDGVQITYSLPLYLTYSVNSGSNCYTVTYKNTIKFKTTLVVQSSTGWTSANAEASFALTSIRVDANNDFAIEGTITPLLAGSNLQSIGLSKKNGASFTTSGASTCGSVSCAMLFKAPVSTFGGFGAEVSGEYDIGFDLYQGSDLAKSGCQIPFTIAFTLPEDPVVIDADTITTDVKFYKSDYSAQVPTLFKPKDMIYFENAITDSSPSVPTGFELRLQEAYTCCVKYMDPISSYNPVTKLGGCKDSAGKEKHVILGSELSPQNGLQIIDDSAAANSNKRYRAMVDLNVAFGAQPIESPLTCQILLISKLQDTRTRRIVEVVTTVALNSDATIPAQRLFTLSSDEQLDNASTTCTSSMIIMIFSAVVACLFAIL